MAADRRLGFGFGVMQVLIVSLGSIGDLMPFLAVAEGLRSRGHDCVIGSNAGYAQLVQGAGFAFAALWRRDDQTLDEIIARDPARAWSAVWEQMYLPAAAPTLDFIRLFAGREKTVLLANWSSLGAFRARAELGVKLATAWLSPQPLMARHSEAGMADADIALFPDWFAPVSPLVIQTGFPLFADALIPPLPPELERFLVAGTPPVILTPGSFMRQARGFFEAGLAACARLGLRAVLLTPYADQVPSLPAFARHYPYIALQRLAPRATAIIHHGGIGTAAQGLRAGIPQLLAPVFYDQFDNAARLETLGVGRRLEAPYDADEIATVLTAILSSKMRAACAALCAHSAKDPVPDICVTIEALA
jgi:UDP:flavonoid glycosyltransferase YjiC (YdhE family)